MSPKGRDDRAIMRYLCDHSATNSASANRIVITRRARSDIRGILAARLRLALGFAVIAALLYRKVLYLHSGETPRKYNSMNLKRVVLSFVAVAILVAGCQKRPVRRITLMTDQPWTIGEAKTCSFIDTYQKAMRCAVAGEAGAEHEYLVDAEFNKMPPVTTEWYGVVCRLDSVSHATCLVE